MKHNSKNHKDYRHEACNESFTCKVCGWICSPQGAGTDHPTHCPNCGGIMDAVGVWVRKNGEWALIHRCRRCGKLSSNRIAADDNPVKLMSIAMRPIAEPPFPIEHIKELQKAVFDDEK